MRIGLISDIHANWPALEAVLDDMPPVDDVVCVGDVVGYGPWPGKCVEHVRDVASVTVQGNHDRNVETPENYTHNRMAYSGLKYAQSELTDAQRSWLATLPFKTEFGDGEFVLVHSHPDPDERGTYVMPRDFSRMRPYLDEYTGIVLGHTHVQHEATIDDRLIVNPGSVGQPRDNDPRAAYAILDTSTVTVTFRRVEYDIDRVISAVEAEDLPVEVGTRLLEGE